MARLFLLTEPNLHHTQDAYLPPSWSNLGTARLAGACLAAGHDVTLFPFVQELIGALGLEVGGRRWLFSQVDEREPTLSALLATQGEDRAQGRLEASLRSAAAPSPAGFFYGPDMASLSLVLKDLLSVASRTLDDPEHPFLARLDRAVDAFGPDWVGVSVTRVGEPLVETAIARLARAGHRVVVGGTATATMDGDARRHLVDGLGARRVVQGPGEQVLMDLLGGPASSPDPDRTGSLGDGDGFELLDLDDFYFPGRILPIQLSRGCYWKRCAYCRREVHGLDYTAADPHAMATHVAGMAQRFGVTAFSINDEALPPAQARAFCKALEERLGPGHGLRFFAAARPERGFTRSLLERMAASGFVALFWGVESGSDRVLRKMRKGLSAATSERVLGDAHGAGITNLCFFMVGFPGETTEDWERTLAFWDRNWSRIAYNRVNPFVLEPGSLVFEQPERFGIEPVGPEAGGASWAYRVGAGMSAGQARAARTQLSEEVAAGRRRIAHGLLTDPPCPGKGDEKLAFFVAQRLLGLRVLLAGDRVASPADLLPLTPRAAEVVSGLPIGPVDRAVVESLAGRASCLVVE